MALKYIEYEKAEAVKPEWLWSGFIRLGRVTLITGAGGVGKSTLTYKIAAAVTTGTALPGQDNALLPPSCCILQNSEDEPFEDTLPQLAHLRADISKIRTIDADGEPLTLLDPRFEEAVAELGAKLLVIDPYTTFLGRTSMYSPQSIRAALNHLQGIAQRHKCAVILVGHVTKNDGAKASSRHLGSVDIRNALRTVLVVGRLENGDYAMKPEKMSRGRRALARCFRLGDCEHDENVIDFEWLGECDVSADSLLNAEVDSEAETSEPSAVSRYIAEMLKDGSRSAREMLDTAAALGFSERTLHRVKKSMGVRSVRDSGDGTVRLWTLPED